MLLPLLLVVIEMKNPPQKQLLPFDQTHFPLKYKCDPIEVAHNVVKLDWKVVNTFVSNCNEIMFSS